MSARNRRGTPEIAAGLLLLAALAPPAAAQHEDHASHATGSAAAVPPARGAVAIDFEAIPMTAAERTRSAIYEHEKFQVRVRLTDAESGAPVVGLSPMAWIDVRPDGGQTSPQMCRQRVGAFVDGVHSIRHGQGYAARPVDDLNAHYILAMTRSPALAVIDPMNSFGKTRLYTTVLLESPGHDWVEIDGGQLLVSLPASGKLAVVNTIDWKVQRSVEVGPNPTTLTEQPERGLVWVSRPAGEHPGVTLVDARTAQVVGRLATGAGPHSIAFSADGARALVVSAGAGTVSVVDVAGRSVLRELELGEAPVSAGFSHATGRFYVLDGASGRLSSVDPATLDASEEATLAAGARSMDIAPVQSGHGGHGAHGAHGSAAPTFGRHAFVINPETKELLVYDLQDRATVRTLKFESPPDQIGFSASFAYLRSGGMSDVIMIPLADPTRGAEGPHDRFPAGSRAPGWVDQEGLGRLMVQVPDMADGIYIVNPAERMIYSYHYMEGMPIPHGGFTTYGFEPTALRVVKRGMQETAPGEYVSTLSLDRRGDYDFMIRVPDAMLIDCLAFSVNRDPDNIAAGIDIEVADEHARLDVGENRLRIRIREGESGEPLGALKDARLQLASTSGWQRRVPLEPLGDGYYEARIAVDSPGAYYASVAIPSKSVRIGDRPPFIYRVESTASAR